MEEAWIPFEQLFSSPSGDIQGPFLLRKDVGFKYMMDASHMPDTLFIVAEADFRFYKVDDMTPEEWAEYVVGNIYQSATCSAKAMARPQPYPQRKRMPRPTGSGFHGAVQKVAEDEIQFSQELQDTITVCNEADRLRL